MLTVPQIEALRKTNPQLYETLKRLAGASLGPTRPTTLPVASRRTSARPASRSRSATNAARRDSSPVGAALSLSRACRASTSASAARSSSRARTSAGRVAIGSDVAASITARTLPRAEPQGKLDGGPVPGAMFAMDEAQLIHDWNALGGFDWSRAAVELNDETLRDGLQSPSAIDPPIDIKLRFLHLMADLGIGAADLGLPGAGPRAVASVRALAREIAARKLPIAPNCAARAVSARGRRLTRLS